MALIKDKKSTLKKMITLKHPTIFNTLIKIQSSNSGQTESEVIERCVYDEFLNQTNENVRKSVELELETGEFSIEKMCESIFCYYSAFPDRATDSLYQLIQLLINLELKNPASINNNVDILPHLLEQLDSLIQYLKTCSEKNYVVQVFGSDTLQFIDSDDLKDLESLYNNLKDRPESVGKSREFITVLLIVQRYWLCGNSEIIDLKNWTRTYRILGDVCRIAKWQPNSNEKIEFLKIAKNIEDKK